MPKQWWIRFGLVIVSLLIAAYLLVPSFWGFVSKDPVPGIFKEDKLKLGLDLQGGLHLTLGVNLQKALGDKLENYAQDLRESLKEKKVDLETITVSDNKEEILVKFVNQGQFSENAKRVKAFIRDSFAVLQYDENASINDFTLRLSMREREKRDFLDNTVRQSLETIRNRIDEFGVNEPSIQTQGNERIIIQLPGISDIERAKALIGRTAKLEFKLVDEKLTQQELEKIVYEAEAAGVKYNRGDKFSEYTEKLNIFAKTKIPEDCMILFEKKEDPVSLEVRKTPYLVKRSSPITGGDLRDAYVGVNQEFNEPLVNFSLNPRGAGIFSEVTGANVGKRLAIVLDNTINSAPSIRSKISGGRAQIELGAASDLQSLQEEARDLAITLRAGALPAEIEFLEERTVGPSLGRDSIQQGMTAMKWGTAFVLIFMLVYYNFSGLLANFGLVVNIFYLLAVMTLFKATLTLPGIAGIVLTIGMAVDANVLIYERIREELRKGEAVAMASHLGFHRALSSILDSNITTAIAGLVLLQYGTGPIKGFAVTLLVGIVCSVLTAVYVTRVFYDLMTTKRPNKLSI